MTLIEFANDIKESQALNERIRKLESEKVQLNQQLNDLILYKKFVIPSYNNLWLNFGSEWNQEEAQKIIDEVSTEYLGVIFHFNAFKHQEVVFEFQSSIRLTIILKDRKK
ncbi:21396_t:CDS:2 [Rhizophagus irregularis]|nr:21396_t:CDS:2 [Rhizophagus irregularis]